MPGLATGGPVDYASLAFRFVLGFVFLLASLPKLAAPRDFARAVANYQLLPFGFVRPVARWLPVLELTAAILLLAGIALPVVAAGASVLLVAFATAVTINLLRGRLIECGCGGWASPKRIGPGLVVRDLVLAAAGVSLAVSAPDVLTVSGASLGSPSSLDSVTAAAVLVATGVAVPIATAVGEARRAQAAAARLLRSLGA
jgi:Methylamine utilisation protein MauE